MSNAFIEPLRLILLRLCTPTLIAPGVVAAGRVAAALALRLRVRDHARRIRELEEQRAGDDARIQAERAHDDAAIKRKLDRIERRLNDQMGDP